MATLICILVFRQEDGSWGTAINMGKEINSNMDDAFGSVTQDGKYFFFHQSQVGRKIWRKLCQYILGGR